jgi:hypothetical protein
MINKKVVVGLLAVLVLFATVQAVNPVLAEDSGKSTRYISVNSGAGEVCWSGAARGCTTSSTTLSLQNGETVTFTATGMNGYEFADWSIGSSMMSLYAALNPYTVTIRGSQYVSADFTPAFSGGGGES